MTSLEIGEARHDQASSRLAMLEDLRTPPYEADEARRQVLYRLPPVPRRARVLEFLGPGAVSAIGAGWPGAAVDVCAVDESGVAIGYAERRASPHGGGYDLAVLHGTLDRLAPEAIARDRAKVATQVFALAVASLRPGGVVAGCFRNHRARDLRLILAALGMRRRESANDVIDRGFSTAWFQRMAAARGIQDMSIYCLFPNGQSPMVLLDTDRHVFRNFARRDVLTQRYSASLPRQLAKRLWEWSALGRTFVGSYFYFGVRR